MDDMRESFRALRCVRSSQSGDAEPERDREELERLRQHLRGSRAREFAQSQTLNLCEAALRVQEEAVSDLNARELA